ncbi:unnamed protein product [Mytilus coruscus]|uniref:Uncharacterized protein n=1 Tax=Mytilus coruscus TaxID=42192 RepID=A0A6J8A4C8_MYTCO|nr:unnamed protein product [Mytilus coruscus]
MKSLTNGTQNFIDRIHNLGGSCLDAIEVAAYKASMDYNWKFVLIVTVLLYAGGKNSSTEAKKQSPVPVEYFTPEVMTPIFEVMRRYGEAKRDKVDHKINQHLLITIVSDDEIDQAKNWGRSFPKKFNKKLRLRFLLNKRDHGKKGFNPNRELHGEVNALYTGEIKTLMNDFKNNRKTKYKYPIILIYSHYIPCAGVPKLGYSCSEELMNNAKGKINNFIMLVAYSTTFKNTDGKRSLDFMRNGGINAFMRMPNGSYNHTLEVNPPSSIDGIKRTFQREAYDCISDVQPSKCITGHRKDRAAITTYFINYLTHQCISKSKATGLFTELSKNQLNACLKDEIDKNIGYDCVQCSKKNTESIQATKLYFQFCFNRSIEVSQGLGRPRTNLDIPNWEPCQNRTWNKIYSPPGPRRNKDKLSRVVCENRIDSEESLRSHFEENKKSRYSKPFLKNKWYASLP